MNKISNMSTIISIVVSTLGTGILAMASSFALMGYAYAIISLIISGICLFFSLYSLSYAASTMEKTKDDNLSYSMIGSFFSKKICHMIDLSILGSNYSLAVFLTIKFTSYSAKMISGPLFGSSSYYENLVHIIVLCCLIFFTYIFYVSEDVSSLNFISKISFSCIMFYLALLVYYAFVYGKSIHDLTVARNDKLVQGFINFIFALHCQFFFLNIYNNMENRSMKNVTRVLLISSLLVTLIYGLSGILGYMAVGNDIGTSLTLDIFLDPKSVLMKNVIKNSFDKNGILPKTCVLGFFFIWFGSIVMASFQNISILQGWARSGLRKNVSRQSVAIIYALSLFAIGIVKNMVDYIKLYLDLSSAIFTNPLSFVFPSLFVIYITRKWTIQKICAYLLLIFSISITANMLYQVVIMRLK